MGREVRMVPGDWQHPKDSNGHFIPMHTEFPYNQEEVKEGLEDGWLEDSPPHYGCDIMPEWPESEKTHLMMYETCTEGTPLSPPMGTAEKLARYLADDGASAFGEATATYEQWLAMAKQGWAPSAIIGSKGLVSGVEAMSDRTG